MKRPSFSKEHREKMRNAKLGTTHSRPTPRAAIDAATRKRIGTKLSENTRQKMSESRIGNKSRSIPVKDDLGNVFSSRTSAAKNYGISGRAVDLAVKYGTIVQKIGRSFYPLSTPNLKEKVK